MTLEIVKFIQAQFINWDSTIYDEAKDMATKAQSSNLNEELGQVEYIFSDKTGTLTQNIMEFKKMCIGTSSYGTNEDKREEIGNEEMKQAEISPFQKDEDITNVNFFDPKFDRDFKAELSGNNDTINKFLLHLTLCHTVIIEKKEKDGIEKIVYNAR